ncbi:hypothetical protein JCM17380_38160 [Desulfosporosinus burensis]|nr:MAG: hypothetical protein VR66_16505 [Peptococcaceae bacterium BRH_c23]HBW35573.1 hypothetical protein [Desulfosporosinus sp.]
MALCEVKKENDQEQVCAGPKRLSLGEDENLINESREIAIKPHCMSEFRKKVAQAIEANNLCYNCETGFHYMK